MRKTARQIHAAGDVMASPRARACAKASATASLATSGSCANAHAARQMRAPCVRYSASMALWGVCGGAALTGWACFAFLIRAIDRAFVFDTDWSVAALSGVFSCGGAVGA